MSSNISKKYKRIGVLDIGSNSVRFVIFELFGAAFTPVYNEKVLAGLGRDLRSTQKLNPQGKNEALSALKRFQTIATAQKLSTILIGATAALRIATDAKAYIRHIKEETGWDISPISGQQEAILTAHGLLAAEPRAHGIAADLGGASLELIRINQGKIENGYSLPIGPFGVIDTQSHNLAHFEPEKIRRKIQAIFKKNAISLNPKEPLYLIGGAWRNLAKIHQSRHLYPLKTIQNYSLTPESAKHLAQWSYGVGKDDILNWHGLSSRRAETLPYGGLLLDYLLSKLKPSEVTFSSTGLREGLVLNALPPKLKKRDALLDGCEDLAQGNLQAPNFAKPLFAFLSPLDAICPAVFSPDNEIRLRKAACLLAGVGKGMHPDYRAGLVFQDILYAPLSGLTHKERAYLALILFHSYTQSQDTPNNHAIQLLLGHKERLAARIYGSAIRLGVVASARSVALLKEFKFSVEDNILYLNVSPEWQTLLTERVYYRLEKFGHLIGMTTEIRK